jgi:hypothetical protein
MSHGLIISLLICLAIFFGSLEQARIVLRRQQKPPSGALEARRNTLHGELKALVLGINQVQSYINQLKKDEDEAATKVASEAQAMLDKAKTIQQEVEGSLDQAKSDNAVQICALKLDQARFHVHHARLFIENHTGLDEED